MIDVPKVPFPEEAPIHELPAGSRVRLRVLGIDERDGYTYQFGDDRTGVVEGWVVDAGGCADAVYMSVAPLKEDGPYWDSHPTVYPLRCAVSKDGRKILGWLAITPDQNPSETQSP